MIRHSIELYGLPACVSLKLPGKTKTLKNILKLNMVSDGRKLLSRLKYNVGSHKMYDIKFKKLPLETKTTLQIENGSLGFIETLHKK